jgi:hypothetical protein
MQIARSNIETSKSPAECRQRRDANVPAGVLVWNRLDTLGLPLRMLSLHGDPMRGWRPRRLPFSARVRRARRALFGRESKRSTHELAPRVG